MILSPVSDFPRYAHLHPRFPAVAAVLEQILRGAFPEGRTELDGDHLYISAAPNARTRSREVAQLEAHRAYIDVQVVLEGTESMGWAPLSACSDVSEPYDREKDIVFFRDGFQSLVTVRSGQVAVYFPEDAHAPLIGEGGTVNKCVVKVHV